MAEQIPPLPSGFTPIEESETPPLPQGFTAIDEPVKKKESTTPTGGEGLEPGWFARGMLEKTSSEEVAPAKKASPFAIEGAKPKTEKTVEGFTIPSIEVQDNALLVEQNNKIAKGADIIKRSLQNKEIKSSLDEMSTVLNQQSSEIENFDKQIAANPNIAPQLSEERNKLAENYNLLINNYKALEDQKKENEKVLDSFVGDKKESNLPEDLITGLKSAGYSLGAGIAQLPAFLYDINHMMDPEWMKVVNRANAEGTVFDYHNAMADFFTKKAEDQKLNYTKNYEGSILEDLEKGNIAEGASKMAVQTVQSLPMMGAIVAASAFGGPAGLVAMGSISAAQQKGALEDVEGMSENQKMVNALGYGAFEVVGEGLPTATIAKYGLKILKGAGKEAAEEAVKKTFTEYAKKAFSKLYPVTAPLSESIGEMATQFGQNFTAKYTGEDPNRNLSDGVVDAGLVGWGMGATLSAPATVVMAARKLKGGPKAPENVFDNPNVSPETKQVFANKFLDENEKNNEALATDMDAIQNMPEADLKKAEITAQKILDNEKAISDPALPESAKKSLQEENDNLQKELDTVIEAVKATPAVEVKKEEVAAPGVEVKAEEIATPKPEAKTEVEKDLEELRAELGITEEGGAKPAAETPAMETPKPTPAAVEVGDFKNVELNMRYPNRNEIIFVSPEKLLERHAKDQPDFDIQKKENRLKGRVEKAKEFLNKYLQDPRFINPKTGERTNTKVSFEPSIVSLNDDGRISFEDGRHRVLASKELGIKEVPIEVPKEQANKLRKELGVTEPTAIEKPAPPKEELPELSRQDVVEQMRPITDQMAKVEMEFSNKGYDIGWDWDNEIYVTDKKTGEAIDPEDLPNDLLSLAGKYEYATSKLGDYDQGAYQEAIDKSRKDLQGEEVPYEEVKPELPPSTVDLKESDIKKGDTVSWEGKSATVLSATKMGKETKYQLDLGNGKTIWTNKLGLDLESKKLPATEAKEPAEKSILGINKDLLGDKKEPWMLEATEREVEQAKRKDTMRGSQYFPKKIRKIKNAIETGKYEKAIKEGRMTASDAKSIIESAEMEVPKSILSLLKPETQTAEKIAPPKAETEKAIEAETPEIANKTTEDIEKEESKLTDRLLAGEAEKRRKDGEYTKDGVVYKRNEKSKRPQGKKGDVRFADKPSVVVPFTFQLIEAEELQPSHSNGLRNPNHFIPETQPKSRTDQASIQAEDGFAENPRFNELGENTNAYSGAPIINERGEVIQGNNRSAGLKKGYRRGYDKYKSDLANNAEQFGFTREQVEGMKNPVLVREIKVTDEGAVELGNYDVKDLETGGKRRLDPVTIVRRIPLNAKAKIAEMLFGEEGKTLNQAIRDNQRALMDALAPYLNQAQRNTILREGVLTETGAKDLEGLIQHFMFDNGDPALSEIFENMSHNQKEGLRKSLPFVLGTEYEKSILPEIQNAILALNEFASSGKADFDTWRKQVDMFTGKTPEELYTPTEIAIAEKLIDAKTQKDITKVFAKYSELVNGSKGDMFTEPTEGVSKKEAIKETFKVEYDEKPKETEQPVTGGEEAITGEEISKVQPKAEPTTKPTVEEGLKAIDDAKESTKKFLRDNKIISDGKTKKMGFVDPEKVIDKAFDLAKGVYKASYNVNEAIKKAIDHIKTSSWYKSLSPQEKAMAEETVTKQITDFSKTTKRELEPEQEAKLKNYVQRKIEAGKDIPHLREVLKGLGLSEGKIEEMLGGRIKKEAEAGNIGAEGNVKYDAFYHQTSEQSAAKIKKSGFNTKEVWVSPDDTSSYGDIAMEVYAPKPKKPFIMDNMLAKEYDVSLEQVKKNQDYYESLGGEANPKTFDKLREEGYDVVIEENGDRGYLYPEQLKTELPQSLKETPKTEEITFEPKKIAPEIKEAKAETVAKFSELTNFDQKISQAETTAKKRQIQAQKDQYLKDNQSIKAIESNAKDIIKQLEEKGLITKKEGPCF